MAQQTYTQIFTDATANYIASILIDPIVNHYKEHPDDEITKEKILAILNLPAPAQTTTTARTPQRSNGTATTQPLTAAAPKRSRSTKSTADRARCKWIFTKGDNVGKQCPGYAIDESEYCSACKNKKGAGGSGRKAATGTTAPAKPATRGGGKSGFTATAKPEKEAPKEADYEINVDDFGESTDGFILVVDSGSGFVLKQVDEETYTVVGFADDIEAKAMRPLTKPEKEKAKALLALEIEDGVELAQ